MKRTIAIMIMYVLNCTNSYAADNLPLLWKRVHAIPNKMEVNSNVMRYNNILNQISMLAEVRDKSDISKKQVILFHYDVNGNVLSESCLSDNASIITDIGLQDNSDMVPISNTKYLVSGMGSKELFGLCYQSQKEKDYLVSKLEIGNIRVRKILDISDQGFLLIGESGNGTARLTKINRENKIVWEKQYDLNKYEYFCDGYMAQDSSYFIVGCSSEISNLFPIPETSIIWLLHLDCNGNIINEKYIKGESFPIMSPKLCELSSGNLILCYDKNPTLNQVEMEIMILPYSFEERGLRTQGLVKDILPMKYYMSKSSRKQDGVNVLFNNKGIVELYQLDRDGNVIGTFNNNECFLKVESFICVDDTAFISAINMSSRNEIKIYAVQLK